MENKKEIISAKQNDGKLNPFQVSLAEFIKSIPEKVSIKEYMKGYSDSEIETVQREIETYNKLNKK